MRRRSSCSLVFPCPSLSSPTRFFQTFPSFSLLYNTPLRSSFSPPLLPIELLLLPSLPLRTFFSLVCSVRLDAFLIISFVFSFSSVVLISFPSSSCSRFLALCSLFVVPLFFFGVPCRRLSLSFALPCLSCRMNSLSCLRRCSCRSSAS